MSNKLYLKQIINEIKAIANNSSNNNFIKQAKSAPAAKGRDAGTKPKDGAVAPQTPSKPLRKNISELQQALREFADTAVSYRTIKLTSGEIIDPGDKKRDFNDFLAEQFMAKADVHGKEYSPEQSATSKQSKAPTDIIQLNNVIDQLRRTGSELAEKKSDGVWDFRTNNAVKNTYAFAAALVEANEALGGLAPNDDRIFTRNDLESFKSAILKEKDPEKEKVDQGKLNESAGLLIPLIKKLTSFYEVYSKGVLENPGYKRYLDQDTALYNFKPGGDNPYKAKPEEEKYIKNPSSFTLPLLVLKNKAGNQVDLNGKVNLETFSSISGITNLLTQYLGYNQSEVSNPRLLTETVRSVLQQVNDFISKYGQQLRPTK